MLWEHHLGRCWGVARPWPHLGECRTGLSGAWGPTARRGLHRAREEASLTPQDPSDGPGVQGWVLCNLLSELRVDF